MKKLYRYEIEYSNADDPDTSVELVEHTVLRETEHTYFISKHSYSWNKVERRVSKTAKKTYAFDTKEKAMKHFIDRTRTRISWYKYWTDECENALKIVEKWKDL